MFAVVPQFLIDAGLMAAAFSSVMVAILAVVRLPPTRFVFRRLIRDPFDTWMRLVVGQIVNDELNARPLTNGWGTRAMHKIAEATGADIEPPHPPRDVPA